MKKYNLCFVPAYPLQNVQLMKDRVVFPYACFKCFGKSFTIVSQAVEDYPYLSYLDGALFCALSCTDTISHIHAAAEYVAEHALEIDLLFLFGPRVEYIEVAKAYKENNSNGRIYLKLDANAELMNALPLDHAPYADFLSSCDIISCEALLVQQLIYHKWQRKVEYIPNGIYLPFYTDALSARYSDKENVILTVGRLGTEQKNSHLLLYAFACAYPYLKEPWDLVMVGSLTDEFKEIVASFSKEFPQIAKHIHLTGSITDKAGLSLEYRRAKIFALSSLIEGFPNVYAEAGVYGCTILTTAIDAAPDMTDFGRLGKTVDSFEVMPYSKALLELCQNQRYLEENFSRMRQYILQYFNYEKSAEQLRLLLEFETERTEGGVSYEHIEQ